MARNYVVTIIMLKKTCKKCGKKSKLICIDCRELLVDPKEYITKNRSHSIEAFFFLSELYLLDQVVRSINDFSVASNISEIGKFQANLLSKGIIEISGEKVEMKILTHKDSSISRRRAKFKVKRENRLLEAIKKEFGIQGKDFYIDILSDIRGRESLPLITNAKISIKKEDEYLELIKQEKDEEVYWYLMGKYYIIKKEFEKAIDAFERSFKTNPGRLISLFAIGNVYSEIENYEEALNIFRYALKYSERIQQIYNRLIVKKVSLLYMCATYEAMSNYEESIKTYKQIIKATKFNSSQIKQQLWLKIALLYNKMGNSKETVESLKKSLDIDVEFKNSWDLFFKTYEGADDADYSSLIGYCEKKLISNYKNAYLWNNLAKAFLITKNNDLALKIYEELNELYPDDEEITNNLSIVKKAQGLLN